MEVPLIKSRFWRCFGRSDHGPSAKLFSAFTAVSIHFSNTLGRTLLTRLEVRGPTVKDVYSVLTRPWTHSKYCNCGDASTPPRKQGKVPSAVGRRRLETLSLWLISSSMKDEAERQHFCEWQTVCVCVFVCVCVRACVCFFLTGSCLFEYIKTVVFSAA